MIVCRNHARGIMRSFRLVVVSEPGQVEGRLKRNGSNIDIEED
jgi:hypothetical protein